MEANEELWSLRTVAAKQKQEIRDLREMFLAAISENDYRCWCEEKEHTPECALANRMLRIYERGKRVRE